LGSILQDGCYAKEECIMIASLCYGIQIEVYKLLKGGLNYFKTYPSKTNNTSALVLKIVNILPGKPNEHFDVIEIIEKEQIKTIGKTIKDEHKTNIPLDNYSKLN
jgi:ribosomal protein L11